MIILIKRNLKLFFRDKSAVFFSLLAVFIIIGLFALFLGDVWVENFTQLANARFIMNTWLIAGILTVTSLTTTLGAFGIMIDDKTKKIAKDFYASPLKRRSITGGYLISAYIIGVIMSLVALILGELYILFSGGELLSAITLLKVFALVLLITMTSTALVGFIVSFFKSQNAFATASTVIGTLIGFITGIYLPIGQLPEAVQWIIKLFPLSHGAALLRQVMLEAPLTEAFAGVPSQYLTEFQEMMGVTYYLGDYSVTPLLSLLILAGTTVLFYVLAIFSMSHKRK